MKTLDSLIEQIHLSREKIELSTPGAFVEYNAIKKKSSEIHLASAQGIIRKAKKRGVAKTVYEFLALEVWNRLLDSYSQVNRFLLRAPKPVGVSTLGRNVTELYMEFINGYELKKLGQIRRTTPVRITGQEVPIPLFPACALYLGVLNQLRDKEGLFHSDYDSRHIIFSPVQNIGIGVVDVENSRQEGLSLVRLESEAAYREFKNHASSPQDKVALDSWYSRGKDELVVPDGSLQLKRVVQEIQETYSVKFDFRNRKVNNISVI